MLRITKKSDKTSFSGILWSL